MATAFTNDQPAGLDNHVKNVAIVGAGGRSGSVIADALIKANKHRVTAITRSGSTNTMPSGLHAVQRTDYDDHSSLVKALQGQEALIITMNVTAPPESQFKLIDAAVEAGVKWIMPNEWGTDQSKVEASKDTFLFERLLSVRQHIEKVGGEKTAWVGLCCGAWYEFSLAGTEARYGFDFEKKTLTLYDDGNTKINTSTFPQVGRAVANLLSLKVVQDKKDDSSPCLSQYKNRSAHISSFFVSQRNMLDSVLKVTGDNERDWTITHEDSVERYSRGRSLFLEEGKMVGFGILLYARLFYKDGAGDFNNKLDTEILGLPEEDFDAATKVGIEMALAGQTNMVH